MEERRDRNGLAPGAVSMDLAVGLRRGELLLKEVLELAAYPECDHIVAADVRRIESADQADQVGVAHPDDQLLLSEHYVWWWWR